MKNLIIFLLLAICISGCGSKVRIHNNSNRLIKDITIEDVIFFEKTLSSDEYTYYEKIDPGIYPLILYYSKDNGETWRSMKFSNYINIIKNEQFTFEVYSEYLP